MSDGQVETSYREIIFHNDDETPLEFVVELLRMVFKKQLADALDLPKPCIAMEKRVAEAIRSTLPTPCWKPPDTHRCFRSPASDHERGNRRSQ